MCVAAGTQATRIERNRTPILTLFVERIRRRTHPDISQEQILVGPIIGARCVHTDRKIFIKPNWHATRTLGGSRKLNGALPLEIFKKTHALSLIDRKAFGRIRPSPSLWPSRPVVCSETFRQHLEQYETVQVDTRLRDKRTIRTPPGIHFSAMRNSEMPVKAFKHRKLGSCDCSIIDYIARAGRVHDIRNAWCRSKQASLSRFC